MANTDRPNGLKPVRVKYGTAPEITTDTAKTGQTFYEGMIICRNTTGLLIPPTTTHIAAGNIIGVSAQYKATTSSDSSLTYYSDPAQEYVVQSDDNSLTVAGDYKDVLFMVVNLKTGNTTTLQSKCELDGSSGSSTAGVQAATDISPLHCLGIYGGIGNTAAVSYTRYIVKIAPCYHLRGMAKVGLDEGTYTGIS